MGNHTIIEETGQALSALLQRFMVPGTVPKEEQIGLCHPKEPGECRVGIYLYDVRESSGIRNMPAHFVTEEVQKLPSVYLDLYYMLIPFSRSDLKYRPSEEQKLLGKMLQVLWDYPNLNSAVCEEEPETGLHTVQVELLDIGYEEKARIWNGLNEAMRVALYCRVNPVELESCRSRSVRRVREMEMQFGERGVDHG